MQIETKKRKVEGQLFLIVVSSLMIAYSVVMSFFEIHTLSKLLIAMNCLFYCCILLIACNAVPFVNLKNWGEK